MKRLRQAIIAIAATFLGGGAAAAADAALIAAAKKEGEVVWYTTQIISQLVRPMSAAFEQKYGIKVRSTRANSTELSVKIINESRAGKPQSDIFDGTSTVVPLKKEGYVLKWLPDAAKGYPAQYKDPEGYWVANNLYVLTPGFNTSLVAKGTEPRTYQALLDPKWRGKIVKAHPGYSGAILTATFVLARELGWSYFEKLAQQKVLQVQSAADPPKKLLLGERAVMADGNDYNLLLLKDQGQPVEVVYAIEGSPLIIVPSGVFRSAPNPNAARLFQSFFFSAEGQQLLVDNFAHRSFHAQVKEKAGHPPLSSLKLLKSDPAAVLAQSEEIKARYAKLFKV